MRKFTITLSISDDKKNYSCKFIEDETGKIIHWRDMDRLEHIEVLDRFAAFFQLFERDV
jgi:hypothetical protein